MTTRHRTAPADTRMMTIVHQALRRDLRRTRRVLTAPEPPQDQQRIALADHLGWMMRFLEHHHHGEDVGLYPAVRERNPTAAPLLDAMDAQHQAVGPAMAGVVAAADAFRSGGAERARLLAAIDHLESVLLPHLRQEEDDAMPVVAATLTSAELAAIDHEYFVKPKSLPELGREGHWLIDGLGPEDRSVVTGTVPPVPRFVLLHAFARGYRRRSAACWGRPDRRVAPTGRAVVDVDAPPEAVWAIVRDPTRVGEWSHECTSVAWLGEATEAVPGARFRGRNHSGIFRWGRICEVVAAEPWTFTWTTVATPTMPDTTVWTIRLDRTPEGGSRIEQTYEADGHEFLVRLFGLLIPAHRDRTEALTADLERLGALARGEQD